MKKPWILGLGGSSHDFSAVISCGNDICAAIEEERLTRRKHGKTWWFQNPLKQSVDYCLNAAGIDFDDVDAIVSSDLLPTRTKNAFYPKTIITYPHHLCHAASVIPLLGEDVRTAILVFDGMGSRKNVENRKELRETFSFFLYEAGKLKLRGETKGYSLEEITDFPRGSTNSLGHLYELITLLLNFNEFQEGKTMGLSSYGYPRFIDIFRGAVTLGETMDKCFSFNPFESDLSGKLEKILYSENWSFKVKADVAASMQKFFEDTLEHCVSLMASWKPEMFALVGGCGLNSVANGKLSATLGNSKQLLIPPYTGDSGLGIGAYWLYLKEKGQFGKAKSLTFRGNKTQLSLARPGKLYTKNEIQKAVCSHYPKLAFDFSVTGPRELAERLAKGEIIGVFNGSSEIGPRALGGRSILADPRDINNRERLNRKIKRREAFRPFAPMILVEAFNEYFTPPEAADFYMLKVANAKKHCKKLAPAVVHIDGTARVQCVDRKTEQFLGDLLSAFQKITGIPILLNTSFNRRGEPIVETPEDALDCFLGLDLDGVYLNGEFYRKPGL